MPTLKYCTVPLWRSGSMCVAVACILRIFLFICLYRSTSGCISQGNISGRDSLRRTSTEIRNSSTGSPLDPVRQPLISILRELRGNLALLCFAVATVPFRAHNPQISWNSHVRGCIEVLGISQQILWNILYQILKADTKAKCPNCCTRLWSCTGILRWRRH